MYAPTKGSLMKKWKSDLILGAVVLTLSLGGILYSVLLQSPRSTYFLARADSYLGLILGILSLLSVMLIVRALKSRSTESGQETMEAIWDKPTVVTAVSLLVYMFVIGYLGFILSSIVLMWLLSYMYARKAEHGDKTQDKKVKLKTAAVTLAFSLAATFCTYWVFVGLLSTKLPKFSLF